MCGVLSVSITQSGSSLCFQNTTSQKLAAPATLGIEMERLQRSLSDRPVSLAPLELKVNFMDQHGVLRRSSTVTKRMLMRDAYVGMLENLSTESDADEDPEKPRSLAEIELPRVPLKAFAVRSMSESEMETPIPREELMRRRSQFQLQTRERKHSIIVELNTRVQDRLQLWHDAAELDPAVETTSQNTAQTPSPRSQTYVDEDGNLRRKSSLSTFAAQSDGLASTDQGRASSGDAALADHDEVTPKLLPSPASLILGKLSPSAPRIRTSLVLEFAQALIDS
ncbi:hypothetical protein PHYPSEUDO_014888 [Phytophthora pseudosyringae]|uniref:Uncharacterized protein n=1 Tax=Phytophthora pseudosyringae TaxID=221518 RepID=A0A8T1VZS6_9STRA|nr:hypothetical protein PHYPSEUDO_014888 [Phytophthora pseudosyringae]